jgi:catechol 2,3-dioxygenase-like lactoylglutathione lyase family enzyme
MQQAIIHVALVVRDYDEAIDFYCNKLHFTLVEDTYQPEQDKRWVVVAPPGSSRTNDEEHSVQEARSITVGCSARGRLLIVAHTRRGASVRLITARRATARERKRHET